MDKLTKDGISEHLTEHHNSQQLAYYANVHIPNIQLDDSFYTLRHLNQLLKFGNVSKTESILEVGSGLGRFSAHMHQNGYNIIASDISPNLISNLQKKIPDIAAKVADINKLNATIDKKFNKVIGFFILHHLVDLETAFKSMALVLEPGGEVVFCEPNAYYLPFYMQILLTPGMSWAVDKGVMNMRESKIYPALSAAGFKDLRLERYGYFPPQLYKYSGIRSLENHFERMLFAKATRAFQIIRARLP